MLPWYASGERYRGFTSAGEAFVSAHCTQSLRITAKLRNAEHARDVLRSIAENRKQGALRLYPSPKRCRNLSGMALLFRILGAVLGAVIVAIQFLKVLESPSRLLVISLA